MGHHTSLWLHDNGLPSLPPGVFDDLSSLEELNLRGNHLRSLPPRIFNALSRLEVLALGSNGMNRLPTGVFDDLEHVVELDLSLLGLDELPPGAFEATPNLEVLNLWGNDLAELRPGVFAGLSKLTYLSLRLNKLRKLPPGVFAGLGSLEAVDLWRNPGSPFPIGLELARTDGDLLAPGPAQVVMRVPAGAPFALRAPVRVQRGTASATWLEVAAGDTASAPIMVGRPVGGTGAVHLNFGRPPGVPSPLYKGFELVAKGQMALFAESDNRSPVVGEAVPAYWMQAGVDAQPLPLSPYFGDPDGDSLAYAVESSDGAVAGGRVLDGVLWMEPRSEGEAALEVTASDPGGLMASQRVTVTVAPPPDPDRFNIELVFGPGFSERHREVARQAARRWEEVVVGDLPDVPVDGYRAHCGGDPGPRIAGVIDDVVIQMNQSTVPLYSFAGVCGRREASGLSFWGANEIAHYLFEPEREPEAHPRNLFYYNVVHEIGHVLGVGTGPHWDGLLRTQPNTTPPDRHFTGPLAVAAFNAAGGLAHPGGRVPVEASRNHWRRGVFGAEVMVPVTTLPTRISAITVQALADIGHTVDVTKADPYRLPAANAAAGAVAADAADEPDFDLTDEVKQWPVIVVDSNGKVVRVIRD